MNERRVSVAGVLAAVVLAGGVSTVVGRPTAFGLTPLGVAIYVVVGIGLPQAILAWDTGTRLHAAIAGIALLGGAAALGVGLTQGTLTAEQDLPLTGLLLWGIVLALVVGIVRSFYTGWRAAEN